MSLYNRFRQDKRLSELTTLGIGGPCKFFIEITTIPEMQEALRFCDMEKIPFLILGKGSNTLCDDRGFNGLVIQNKISYCTHVEEDVDVGAGYSFSLLGSQTARKGWSGLEFASGIPATVGGAIYMNAGANGSETCDVLREVTFVHTNGALETFHKSQLAFSYRSSSFQKMKGAIVSAKFGLSYAQEAREKQLKIIDYRTKTQPYGDKSAGCIFRNPTPQIAGALIQQCGLKGTSVGGAEVSELHGNFIINKGGATAQDVIELAKLVQKKVKEHSGIDLEMEVRSIPYDLQS